MLFDPVPKEDPRDFFDREAELRAFVNAIERGERLVVVYGVRRVGKSSLVRVGLRMCSAVYSIIDVRELYFSEGFVRESSLARAVLRDLVSRVSALKRFGLALEELLRGFRVSFAGAGLEIELRRRRLRLADILKRVDEWCSRKGTRFVLVLDEAQYARFSNTRYDGIIAWAVDNLSSITIVVTGSEVGVLRDFLRLENPEAPLFGRFRREIELERFSRDTSIEFLRRGFDEIKMSVSLSEIEEAVNVLDGVPGWLTLYGYYRATGSSHRQALETVIAEGTRLVLKELEHIIAPSRSRYAAILKAVALGASSWSDIKAFVEAATRRPIDSKRLTTLIKNLIKYGYLEKRNGKYGIPDPLVRIAVRDYL